MSLRALTSRVNLTATTLSAAKHSSNSRSIPSLFSNQRLSAGVRSLTSSCLGLEVVKSRRVGHFRGSVGLRQEVGSGLQKRFFAEEEDGLVGVQVKERFARMRGGMVHSVSDGRAWYLDAMKSLSDVHV